MKKLLEQHIQFFLCLVAVRPDHSCLEVHCFPEIFQPSSKLSEEKTHFPYSFFLSLMSRSSASRSFKSEIENESCKERKIQSICKRWAGFLPFAEREAEGNSGWKSNQANRVALRIHRSQRLSPNPNAILRWRSSGRINDCRYDFQR